MAKKASQFNGTPILPRPGLIQQRPEEGMDISSLVNAAAALAIFVKQVNDLATAAGTQQPRQPQYITESIKGNPQQPLFVVSVPAKNNTIAAKTQGNECSGKVQPTKKAVANSKAAATPGERFPTRLMKVLESELLKPIIAWLPDGCSFAILDQEKFATKVMPEFFAGDGGSTKYQSFVRKLNRWGFRQINSGPNAGAFYHGLFRRDSPNLCNDMSCRSGRSKKVSSSKKAAKAPRRSSSMSLEAALSISQCPEQTFATVRPASTNLRLPHSRTTCSTVVTNSSASSSDCESDTIKSVPGSVSSSSTSSLSAMEMVDALRNNYELLERAHRKIQAAEHLRIARAMLREAYLKALSE